MAAPPTDTTARRTQRRKLFQPAELRHGGGVQRVHLLDLSTSGGLIHAEPLPTEGATVILACGSLTRMARVAWASERRVGLSFFLPLAEAERDAVLVPGR